MILVCAAGVAAKRVRGLGEVGIVVAVGVPLLPLDDIWDMTFGIMTFGTMTFGTMTFLLLFYYYL